MPENTQQSPDFRTPGARGPPPASSREWSGRRDGLAGGDAPQDPGLQRRSGRDDDAALGPLASAVLGGALVLLGLKRGSLGGVALAAAGGGFILHGTRERAPARHRVGIHSRTLQRRSATGEMRERAVLQRSITIQQPAQELYRAWRSAGTLSRVMGHYADVTDVGPDRQHWRLQGPRGTSLEWDSHIVEEHPGELLRWESLEGSQLSAGGWVRFRPAPADWGTEVTLKLEFSPPGGALGQAAMKLLGAAPSVLAHVALRRFKSLMETGEIATTRPNPAAREGGYSY
jgi:uncharacterized membrane protein